MQVPSFVRSLLIIFNTIFCLCGLALIISAVFICINIKDIPDKLQSPTLILSIGTIIIGCIVLIVAFFGRSGTVKESYPMVITHGILLLALVAVQVYVAIFVFMKVKDLDRESFDEIFRKKFDEYWISDLSQRIVDCIQTNFQCCGIDNLNDFSPPHLNMNGTIPKTCCKSDDAYGMQACPAGKIFQTGCSQTLFDFLHRASKTLGCIVGLELIGLIPGAFVARYYWNKRKKQKCTKELAQNLIKSPEK